MLPTVEGAPPLPCAVSMCAPVPSISSQAFLPLLKKAAQGSPGSGLNCSKAAIVNISSIGGSIASAFGWELMQVTSYRCSKAALNMLSKCQSLAYKEHGILCVALHPGWVQTDMGSAAGHAVGIPLGRVHQSSWADFAWLGVAVLSPCPWLPCLPNPCWSSSPILVLGAGCPHSLSSHLSPSPWGFQLSLCPGAALSPGSSCYRALSQALGMGCISPCAPQPPVTVDDSVQGMLKVLSSLS
uniref:C-factor n=1 Tax=Zonotrichia albicollis TaxID=44394 RepID=A0A8D2M2A6_ZONAL